MFGKFVLKLFGGSKTRKVSRKKRGGKIVLDNQKGGKIILNKKKTKKLKGGKIVLDKKNQNGGQCGARKLNQGGGATRREILLPRQPGVIPPRGPHPPPSYFTGMNATPKPWTHRKKSSGKKQKKKSEKKSEKKSGKKSGKHAPSLQPQKKRTGRRSHSLAARAANMNELPSSLHKR
jgi:hypothetical protein